MASLIDVEEAIRMAKESDKICKTSIWETDEVVEFLENCSTVDAVPVIRCKDCMYCIMDVASNELWCDHCKGLSSVLLDTDFCSYGERRTDEAL